MSKLRVLSVRTVFEGSEIDIRGVPEHIRTAHSSRVDA